MPGSPRWRRWTVSRWMPDGALSSWLLWPGTGTLRLLRRTTWRADAPWLEHERLALADASPDTLLEVTRAACRLIGSRLPLQLTLTLPQRLTPALGVEFAAEKMPPAMRQAYLTARFQQVFGAPALGWRVVCDRRVRQGRSVAFACEDGLASSLSTLSGGLSRIRTMPAVAWGARRALRRLRAAAATQEAAPFNGWYVHQEDDRDVALWLADGRASQVAVLPSANDTASPQRWHDRLTTWSHRLGLPEGADLLIGGADAQALQSDERITRLGLFGGSDAARSGR